MWSLSPIGIYIFVRVCDSWCITHSFLNDLERITSLHYMPSEGPYFLPSRLFPHTYVLTYPEMAFFSILLMGSFDLLSLNEHRNLIRYVTGYNYSEQTMSCEHGLRLSVSRIIDLRWSLLLGGIVGRSGGLSMLGGLGLR